MVSGVNAFLPWAENRVLIKIRNELRVFGLHIRVATMCCLGAGISKSGEDLRGMVVILILRREFHKIERINREFHKIAYIYSMHRYCVVIHATLDVHQNKANRVPHSFQNLR